MVICVMTMHLYHKEGERLLSGSLSYINLQLQKEEIFISYKGKEVLYMSKIPVSVCIIAKNEEKYIEGCLRNLLGYGFEIVVADTGSTDRTREIAANYADKVVDFEWCDDFSAARNFCAAQASNNWVLSLDCDEYMQQADITQLRIIMQKFPRYVGMIRLKNLAYNQNGEKRYACDDVTRFYNRNFFHYEDTIHEQLRPKSPAADRTQLPSIMLPVEVIHYGYLISKEEMQEKQKRNLKLLYTELEKDPDSPYLYFQIGQSEAMLGNNEAASQYYEKGLSYDVSPDSLYVETMIESLATVYARMGEYDKAQAVMEKYQDQCHTAKYTFMQANIYLDNDQPWKALLYYIKTTMMNDTDSLGEGLLSCYEKIIDLYNMMGEPKMAAVFEDKYQQCMAERRRVMGE